MKLKALLISAIALTALPANASNKPSEADLQAMALIKAYGYTCDTYSGSVFNSWSQEYSIHCNNYRYHYIIKDVGGKYVVEVQ